MKRILISGAGIAGPTLAYWLHRYGFKVTVIEKAPALRLGGQNIDVSDAAVEVVKLMGIEKEILAHNTTEIGLRFVNENDEVEAELPKGSPTSFTSKYEILRGDLTQIIYDLTRENVTYRFDETIKSLDVSASAVDVEFASGSREKFDLVISAEGVSSSSRPKIVTQKHVYKYLGVYTSYMTIPKRESDTKWARWHNAPGGKVFLLRPDNKGTTRASFDYWCEPREKEHFTQDEAVAKIRSLMRGTGWESERLAQDLTYDPDIYLGPVQQVRLKKWSHGRCALVGDAAYCPTPFTGMGTTLAVIGAYVLAGELSKHDYEKAFANYEAVFRPFVEEVQKVIPGQFRLVYPKSKWGVTLLNKTVSVLTSKPVQDLFARFGAKPKENDVKFALPRY